MTDTLMGFLKNPLASPREGWRLTVGKSTNISSVPMRRHSGLIFSIDADAGFRRARLCACTHRLSLNPRPHLFRRIDLPPQHSAQE